MQKKYKNVTIIDRLDNKCIYSFPRHSAGPYGIDIINSPWMKAWQMDLYLKFIKPGWKDIHASFDDLSNNDFWWQMSVISKAFIKKARQKVGLRTRLAKMFSSQ